MSITACAILGTAQMGALNICPGQPQEWAPGTGGKDVLVESAPQRRLSNTRIMELPL